MLTYVYPYILLRIMNVIERFLQFIVFACFIYNNVVAQSANYKPKTFPLSPEKFGQISVEQGLSQSSVFAISQDIQGFMWFGTQDGLNRYDGYSIKVFKHDPADSNSISDDAIWSLLSDSKGNLWIGTVRGGVDRYAISENKFYHYIHSENDSTSISENYITTLFEDSFGNIWLGSFSRGLNRFNRDTDNFTHFFSEANNPKSLCGNDIKSICEDKSGYLWIATFEGLSKLKINSRPNVKNEPVFIRYKYSPSNHSGLSENNISTVYADDKGTIWIGTLNSGLNRYDEKTNSFKRYKRDAKNPLTLSSNYISSIRQDLKGNLWIASSVSGLMLYNYNSGEFIKYYDDVINTTFVDKSGILWLGTFSNGVKTYDLRKNWFKHFYDDPNKPDDLNGNIVMAILEEKDGVLWVGTWGGGLNCINRNRNKVKSYLFNSKNKSSLSDNRVVTLIETKDGFLWVGTQEGLNRFNKKNGEVLRYKNIPGEINSISFNDVSTLYEDSKNNLWIGGLRGGLDRFSRKTNTFIHYNPDPQNPQAISGIAISKIFEDSKGEIWIATLAGGLHCYDPGTDSFKRYYPLHEFNPAVKTGISLNISSVNSIYEDDAGILWFGTYSGGLNRFDRKQNSFIYYTELDGLSNNLVYGILPDKSGNLWLSTNNGISRFNLKTGKFRNFYVSDGLQANEFNHGSFFLSSTGEMFFGGINGFNAFFPDEIEDNENAPLVYFANFKVFDKTLPLSNPISENQKIELSYSQNFFTFEFVALNYTSPEKNQFAYMLEGFDKDWHQVTALQRYGSYTNLDPGNYLLHVKAANDVGKWNEKAASINIIIKPPYWMTWWFRTAAVIFIFSIFFGLYRIKIKRIIEIEKLRFRIASDLHDEVGASLTSLSIQTQLLNSELDKKRLDQKIGIIEELSRKVIGMMSDVVWSIDSRNDSMQNMIDRMKDFSSQILNDKNIQVEYDITLSNPEKRILLDARHNIYLIFKEAINNIAKHSNAKNVEIRILSELDTFEMSISDDGIGNKAEEHNHGNGMRNMALRAEKIKGKIDFVFGNGLLIKLIVNKL